MLRLQNNRRATECVRKGMEASWRGVELRLARGITRWNEHGVRKGVARCLVPTCFCSGRANFLVRKDV
jgi:hypothetical protein